MQSAVPRSDPAQEVLFRSEQYCLQRRGPLGLRRCIVRLSFDSLPCPAMNARRKNCMMWRRRHPDRSLPGRPLAAPHVASQGNAGRVAARAAAGRKGGIRAGSRRGRQAPCAASGGVTAALFWDRPNEPNVLETMRRAIDRRGALLAGARNLLGLPHSSRGENIIGSMAGGTKCQHCTELSDG